MAKRPLYYMGLALACEKIDQKADAISDKIARLRAKGAQGGGEDEDDGEE